MSCPSSLRLGLVGCALLLTACNSNDPKEMARGDQLYSYYCIDCHRNARVGANLENAVSNPFRYRHHEVMLIIRHGYDKYHPRLNLRTLVSPEQADRMAAHVMQLVQARETNKTRIETP